MVNPLTLRRLVIGLGTTLVASTSMVMRVDLPWPESHILAMLGPTLLLYLQGWPWQYIGPFRKDTVGRRTWQIIYRRALQAKQASILLLFNIAASIPIYLHNVLGFLVAITILPVWYYLTMIEERALIVYWGDIYVNCARELPRLIPTLRRWDRFYFTFTTFLPYSSFSTIKSPTLSNLRIVLQVVVLGRPKAL